MSLIVAARFDSYPSARSAAYALFAEGFPEAAVSIFYIDPRGQGHAAAASRRVETRRPTYRFAAIAGSALFAMAGVLLALWVAFERDISGIALIVAAAAGAYLGSLAGAAWLLSHLWHQLNTTADRNAAVVLTVQVEPEQERSVAALLRDADGKKVERAKGGGPSIPTAAPVKKGGADCPRRAQLQL